ncbi:MAG: hypothetical protein Q8J88_00695 [Bacteroidales bacterium]|nr:hypothetical protein [Bacteroidales bacterium]
MDINNWFVKSQIVALFIVFICPSCSAQKTLAGKYYHKNPFSSDTLDLYNDGTFKLFLNKELLQQRISGTFNYENDKVKFKPLTPHLGGYHEKSTSSSFFVFDLLTNELISAEYTIISRGKVLEKGNTFNGIKTNDGDTVIFSQIGYIPYELNISKIINQEGYRIYLAPDYYFLKGDYWEAWEVKKSAIVTPFEKFKKE